MNLINISNRLGEITEQNKTFKAYISLGNNGALVKSVLKKWSWWQVDTEDLSECNFIWTEWIWPNLIEKFKKAEWNMFVYSKV